MFQRVSVILGIASSTYLGKEMEKSRLGKMQFPVIAPEESIGDKKLGSLWPVQKEVCGLVILGRERRMSFPGW